MLKLFNVRCNAEILELREWLIQIFSYETATDLGHTVTEWIDNQGGWVRSLIIEKFKSCIN